MTYDPIVLSQQTERFVVKGTSKKYYRFRSAKFYGGIATADTVGCNLRCKFCWSGRSVWQANQMGELYTPQQVASTLIDIAQKNGFTQVRISGGEPTIGQNHLSSVLSVLPSQLLFILETNGLLLGYDKKYVDKLSCFDNLHIRVCLKGVNEKEFKWLTGAKSGFHLQLKALEFLRDNNISFSIALVSVQPNQQRIFDELARLHLDKKKIEVEEIVLYPQVKKRLKQEGILHFFE
jgi:uncharacterized Fe-S cluster-containing radical SAM superfamily protein